MAGFASQSNALLKKNLTFQKRNCKTNLCMVIFPILLCSLMSGLQHFINHELGKLDNLCDSKEDDLSGFCPVPKPPKWTPLLQIPRPYNRAVKANLSLFQDLPDDSCRKTRNCPATILYTGKNRSLAEGLVQNFFPTLLNANHTDVVDVIPDIVLGTDVRIGTSQFFDGAFSLGSPIYVLQSKCTPNFTSPLQNAECLEALTLWRNSAATINTELYQGFPQGNIYKKTNELAAAYDLLASTEKQYMADIWYNAVGKDNIFDKAHHLVRVPRSVNLVSNAYLKFLRGFGTKMQFDFVKEMPKGESKITFDLESLIGIMFYVWIVELLFPVMLTYLVYEKQHKLKIMMKMHGLGDGPYWIISYLYFLLLSSMYILLFVIFGALIGLNFFKMNQYSVQFAFYFICINLQIALAFFVASFFSNVKTATVIGYIYVFASGILGTSLFAPLMEDITFPRIWVLAMECFPAFSLYRGMYELSQYSTDAKYSGFGMKWENLNDKENEMGAVMILMGIEWLMLLLIGPFRNCVLCCCQCFRTNPSVSTQKSTLENQGSNVTIEMEKHDVVRERELVEQIMREPNSSYAIVCNNLKKKYPGRDGNPEKIAVKGLSLALPRGECFGILGPNGAGKTSWFNMMIGLTKPTSGTAYVEGMDIQTSMSKVYNSMGVCPQHDLLWETLTGREHLLFYGRLKNLNFGALDRAVVESLKSVNLYYGGIADKQAGKYSGGMKRRLSVAISLIGDPKVVYMDEPSTGLDPASRNHLWNVVKKAKHDRAIVLTTHSMEEAEVLCDRLGIYVDGSLQCIGNPKELKARYGGTYVLTMTTSHEYEAAVQQLVHRLSPKSVKVYHISGTQKFELPKSDIAIAEVFQQVENAKKRFPIEAWGIADTTLEDVFIKVARGAEAFN